MEARHQLALLQVLADNLSHTRVFQIYESLMELLTSTDKVLVGHLEKNKMSTGILVIAR